MESVHIPLIGFPWTCLSQNYLWQDGSTLPAFTVTRPGLYTLTEKNDCGQFTDSIKIEIGPCVLRLPSAFTPDHDGKNDLFRIKYTFPVNQFHLAVFNRWGLRVFETTDINAGWNGMFKGIDQPADVYVWIVSVIYPDNKKEMLRGTVALIR